MNKFVGRLAAAALFVCVLGSGSVSAQSILISGGSAQSAAVNATYAAPLVVQVLDAGNSAVSGATVTFTLPASGASGTFPGSVTTAVVVTDGGGMASSPAVTANATVGAFAATVTATGVATSAAFSFLNTSGPTYTVVVTPTTPDWLFLAETGTGAGTFVSGPATPPAGTGSVQVQAVSSNGGELFYTQQFAGMRLDTVKGLQFSTFVVAGTNAPALNLDVDANLAAPTGSYEGRLVFSPGLLPGAVVPGVWQTWDAYTQQAWFATRAPINTLCTQATPCTLAQILTAFPNAGVIAQLFPGVLGFKLGNNGATGTVAVDKFVLVSEGPPGALTGWTYDFEPVAPAAATVIPTAGIAQSTAVNSTYGSPLSAQVRDAAGQLLSGVTLSFALPASGASGTFPGNLMSATAVTTSASGQASSPVVTANGSVGAFLATATAAGLATPGSFSLLNTNGAAFTVVVTPTTPDWTFATETAPGTGSGTFVTGPATPPAGTGSVQLQALATEGSEFFSTPQFAGMRLDSLKGLQFSTFVVAGAHVLALDMDVDTDLTAPTATYEGRLNFDPGLITPNAVIPGVWQTWDAYTQKGWYGSRAPINAFCSLASPCTLAQVLAIYPNVGVIAQLFPGSFGFKLGNNHATGTVAVDKLVLVREGPPATLTAWTYDLEPVSPAAATVTATAGTPQSTAINTPFALPLTAQIRDTSGQMLSGVTVTFALPNTGASGAFPGSALSADVVTTSVSGQATSPVITANAAAGSYAATAAAGEANAASYALTNTQGSTTTALGSSLNPSTFGASVTFTATIAPAAATGTVSFYDGVTLLGTGTLTGGVATYATTALAVQTHSITAVYGGDANYVGSASAILNQVVNQATTTTSLGAAPNPSTYTQAVTLTAAVGPSTATGTVTFFDGAVNLG
jgi:Bacterial Ig-like domain (group 3)